MVWFVAAGGLLLCAVLAGLVAAAVHNDTVEVVRPGPTTFEGEVASQPTAPSPVGAPLVVGHVEVAARFHQRRGLWQTKKLLEEVRGDPRVKIRTAEGERVVEVRDPLGQLRIFDFETERVTDLAGHPEDGRVPGWRRVQAPGGFVLKVLALRPGDPVVAELGPDGARLWRGTFADQEARLQHLAAKAHALSRGLSGLAVVCALGAVVSLVLGLR